MCLVDGAEMRRLGRASRIERGVRPVFHLPHVVARPPRGPAKNQMIRPTKGSTKIKMTHSTFDPVLAPLWMTFMIAQMSRARIIRPIMPP